MLRGDYLCVKGNESARKLLIRGPEPGKYCSVILNAGLCGMLGSVVGCQ